MENKSKSITYAKTGVGGTYKSKAEKTSIIVEAVQRIRTSKDKYVIGKKDGFAGCFDLGIFIDDKNKEEESRQYAMHLVKKYNLTPENYEQRFPYIMAAEWLESRLNLGVDN